MARTTATEVKTIITTALQDSEITSIIEIANRMVTNILSGSGLTDAQLEDIEMFLTAHLISISKERQAMTEKVGDVWITFQGQFGMGLELTTYGQTVLMLDSTGSMQRASKKKIRIRAIQQDSDNASELTSDQW